MITVFMHSPMHYEYLCELGNALENAQDISVTYISVKDYNYRDQLRFPLTDLYPDYSTMHSGGQKFIAHIKAVCSLIGRLKVERPHIFHVQGFRHAIIDWPVLVIAKWLGIKTVLTVHNLLPHESSGIDRIVYRFVYKVADKLIAHTKHTAEKLVKTMGADASKIVVIPHGSLGFQIDSSTDKSTARKALGFVDESILLLFFGRIRHYKGVDLLIEAVNHLGNPKVKLVIAGHDQIGLTGTIGENPNIAFNGNYIDPKDVGLYFSAADLVVLPYRKIDQSGVLLLAMATGTAVLGTKVGGIQEIIQDGVNGFLCNPNSADALTEKLCAILEDQQRLVEVGTKGKETVNKLYDWGPIAENTANLYRQFAGLA